MENNITPIVRTWRQFVESRAYTIFEHATSSTKYGVLVSIGLCELFESEKVHIDILNKSTGEKVSVKDFMKSKEFKKINEILSYIDWTLMAICFDPNNSDEWQLFPATLGLEMWSLNDNDIVDNIIDKVSEKLSLKNYYDAVKDGTYEL